MIFNIDHKTLLLSIFVFQELIFSGLLLKKGIDEDSSSIKWLSFLILLCAMYLAPWMLGNAGWYSMNGYREFLFFIPFHQYFLFGPVMFFLTKTLTEKRFALRKKHWLHFIPAGLYLTYSIVVAVTDLILLDEFYFYADGMDKDYKPWYQILGLASMSVYAVISMKNYKSYRIRIYQTLSYADSVKLNWLRDFLLSLVLIIILRGIFIMIFPEIGDWGFKWWYYLLFGIISFYLSIAGYTSSIKLSAMLIRSDTNEVREDNIQKSSIGQEDISSVLKSASNLIEEKGLYKNPSLSLSILASEVGTNTSILSRSINQGVGQNFNDFINSFRIRDVKRAIEKGELKNKTLEGLALEAGFNSKSTFIRSFKKATGMTPTDYKKSL